MDNTLIKRTYRLPRNEIALLRFVLESYDGLAFLRTLERREALVEIAYPPSRRPDAEALLAALAAEFALCEVPMPEPGAYPGI